MSHTGTVHWHNVGVLRPSWGMIKHGQRLYSRSAAVVVDFDGDDGRTAAFIPNGQVHSATGDWKAAGRSVDVDMLVIWSEQPIGY